MFLIVNKVLMKIHWNEQGVRSIFLSEGGFDIFGFAYIRFSSARLLTFAYEIYFHSFTSNLVSRLKLKIFSTENGVVVTMSK